MILSMKKCFITITAAISLFMLFFIVSRETRISLESKIQPKRVNRPGKRIAVKKKTIQIKIVKLYYSNKEPNSYDELVLKQIPALNKTLNKGILSTGTCVPLPKEVNKTQDTFILVTNALHYSDGHYNVQLNKRIPTAEEIENRWLEIMNTLQSNLKHPIIKLVVVLVENQKTGERLHKMDFENSDRLVIQVTNKSLSIGLTIEFATRCYQDQIVSISHMDNRFGEGWHNFRGERMRQNKFLYALTRYSSSNNCTATKAVSTCDGGVYLGSHDTFIFHVKNQITEKMLGEAGASKSTNPGVENVLLASFLQLKYQILNPCFILKVHHEHCIPIRDVAVRRINVGKVRWAVSGFTKYLGPAVKTTGIKVKVSS